MRLIVEADFTETDLRRYIETWGCDRRTAIQDLLWQTSVTLIAED